MKNIILILVLILAYGCGTDQGEGTLYKYTVKNESGKALTIKGYLPNFPDVSPIITNLSIGEELTKTFRDVLPPSGYNFSVFFGENDAGRDSIKVIYNNLKVSFFKEEHSQNEKNPLNINIYRDEEETFIFTEQDYDNAEDCNGNCN